MRLRHRRQERISSRGDTIVEVMLAMAIISSVLGGAFWVSQKSSQAIRDAQERGEALQIMQAQVEAVRTLALKETSGTTGVYSHASGTYFCVNPDPVTHENKPYYLSAAITTLPALNSDNFNNYQAVGCQFGYDSRYNIAATYDSSTKVFTFTGRWDRISGGRDEVDLAYKINP